jgi:hypothetical protein
MNTLNSIDILKKYSNHILLVVLIIIVSLITYYRVLIQFEMGPLSDSCDFLSNALVFAGQNMSYFDPTRPPFFSFLLSLIFRTGYVSTNAIFVLDGLMYIFGVVGLFFLLKLRFNDLQSFLGALLFATFSEVLSYVSVGFADIASVSLTIWAFYFLILAVKKGSKFFYLAFPFAMLAFLTRYNNALIIFPIFLYILINRHEIKNIKHLFAGILSSFLFIIPVFIFFLEKFGNAFYPFMSAFGTTSTTHLADNAAYDSNLFFFINKLPAFIGLEGVIAIFIIAVGLLIYGFLKLKRNSIDKKNLFKRFKIRKNSTKLKIMSFTVLLLIFVCSFGQILSYFSEVLFFILAYLFYDLVKNLNVKDMDMHLLFFAWFMAFFIFHSVLSIKDNRYFIIMAPPIAYFLIFGLTEISNRLKFKIKGHNATFPIITVILTAIILLSTASYLPVIKQANEDNKITNEQIVLACEWFMNYDSNYKNTAIYSDLWPFFGWYLKTNVDMMPVFMDGQIYTGGVKEFKVTLQDNMAYNNELNENNATYYFCIRKGLNLTSYKPIKQFGNLIIYKRL